MDRLVEEGLIERRPDPDCRRTTLITLTGRGRALFERVVPAHLTNERRLLSALSHDECAALAALPAGAALHLTTPDGLSIPCGKRRDAARDQLVQTRRC